MGIFRIALVVQICLLLAACGASQRGAAGPIALASVDPLSVSVSEPTLLLDFDAEAMRSDQTLGPIITALLEMGNDGESEESEPSRGFQDRILRHAAEHCSRVTLSVRSGLDFEEYRDSAQAAPGVEAADREGVPAGASGDSLPNGDESSHSSGENSDLEAAMIRVHCPTGNEEIAAMVDAARPADPNEVWHGSATSPVRQVGRRVFVHTDGAGIWLMATTAEEISGLLDGLAQGEAPELSSLGRDIAGAPEAGTRALRAGFVDRSREAHEMNAPGTSGLTLPSGGRYALDFDLLEQRFSLTVNGVFADEASAQAAVEELSASRASLASFPPVLMLGLAGPLAEMELAHEGNAMRLDLPIARAVVDGVYRLATSVIAGLQAAGQQQGEAASGERSEEL